MPRAKGVYGIQKRKKKNRNNFVGNNLPFCKHFSAESFKIENYFSLILLRCIFLAFSFHIQIARYTGSDGLAHRKIWIYFQRFLDMKPEIWCICTLFFFIFCVEIISLYFSLFLKLVSWHFGELQPKKYFNPC